MLVGDGCRLTAARVDDHQFAAALLDRFQTLFDIRYRHDAAVGRQRVAAENQHEVGVIDIRNRQQHAVAIHKETGEVMRQLIDRRGRKAIAGLEQAEKVIAVGHQPIVMHAGVALINRYCILPMALLNGVKPFSHQIERLLPGNRLPLITSA